VSDIGTTPSPKDYLNIVNSYFATTGNRLVENNSPNSMHYTQTISEINTNNLSNNELVVVKL